MTRSTIEEPVLISPNLATDDNGSLPSFDDDFTIHWNPVKDAAWYEVYVYDYDDDDYYLIHSAVDITGTSYEIPVWDELYEGGQFRIVLEAYDQYGNGEMSRYYFTVGDPDYMEFMSSALKIAKNSIRLPSESVAELAVFVDEDSFAKNSDNEIGVSVVNRTRRSIGLIGVPKDMYLTSDFEKVKEKYKAFISLVPTETEGSKNIRAYAKEHSIPLFEITIENANVTSAELREFCKASGIFIYSQRDAVIYANESYVFIHTGEDGKQALSTPDNSIFTDVFSDEKFNPEFTAKIGESFLLKKQNNT